jgi:hypothetical protein
VQTVPVDPGTFNLNAYVSGQQPTGVINFAESSTGLALGSVSVAPAKGLTFTVGPTTALPLGPNFASGFAAADLNQDDVLDIAVTYFYGVLFEFGDPLHPGQFLSPQNQQLGLNGQIIAADVNRDGIPDIVAWNGSQSISVALGNAAHPGQFLPPKCLLVKVSPEVNWD